MRVQTIPPQPVLYFRTETTIRELGRFAYTVAEKLYAEALRQEQLPAGPIHWLYYGCTGEPDQRFTLEIALPLVEMPGAGSGFEGKELPSFSCVTREHTGRWEEMTTTYGSIFQWMATEGHRPSGVFREVYLHLHPGYQVTEIQVGIEEGL
ncbi:MAG TPA: GyrI-like domain-containing protein [Chitinophagaceae bacterium]|jgi:effector-binding domain-containing protein|nr:GyrI-like domain-containing protein [Chitinophagaceae bacterium]